MQLTTVVTLEHGRPEDAEDVARRLAEARRQREHHEVEALAWRRCERDLEDTLAMLAGSQST